MSVYTTRLKLDLEIEGVGERLPLSACVTNFAINQLPSATCTLAIGRDAYTGKVAQIHKVAQKDMRLAKAKIWMRAYGQFDADYNWPNKEVVIFEGRIVGPGQIVGTQAGYTLSLVHWLADLHYSSSVSNASHPSNPTNITWRAVAGYLAVGSQSTKTNNTMQTVSLRGMNSAINEFMIRDDVWGQGLKRMLCGLAKQAHIKISTVGNPCEQVDSGENSQALEALKRIDGDAEECSREYSPYAPKLSLLATEVPEMVTSALLQMFTSESIHSSISQTFWSKIVHSYAGSLLCGVVPLVDHALFAAVTPGLRKTYCKEIAANDYENGRFVFPVNEPLRAVGIISEKTAKFGTTDTTATGKGSAPQTLAVTGIGGCYAPADAHKMGTIRFYSAPLWLANIKGTDFSMGKTTGIEKKDETSSAFTPLDEVNKDIKGGSIDAPEEKKVDQIEEMFRAYARSLFVTSSLRGRAGSLMGKLRFDIAPGSNVKIHAKHERFIGTADELVTELIGTVVKVTSVLDAEQKEAMTTFEFAYVRTVEENKNDSYSLDSHPLFQPRSSFVGAPLIDKLQFGNGKCNGNGVAP